MSLNLIIALLIIIFNVTEILVHNEEIIIVICFVLFLSMAYKTVGSSVASDFDDRSQKICEELRKSTKLWHTSQTNLLSSWSFVLELLAEIRVVFTWSKSEVSSLSSLQSSGIGRLLAETITQRLEYLMSSEMQLHTSFRQSLTTGYFSCLAVPTCLGLWYHIFSASQKKTTFGHGLVDAISGNSSSILETNLASFRHAYASQLSPSSLSLSGEILLTELLVSKLLSSKDL